MDGYVAGFSCCALAGLMLVGIGRYYPDLRNSGFLAYYFSDQAINGPLEEIVGGFLTALGVGGLAGTLLLDSPGSGLLLGLVSGAIVGGRIFLQRADTWGDRLVDDTMGVVNPTVGFIGREARVVATIVAGLLGEISLRDDDGQWYGLAATADVDIAVGSAVTVTGVKGLDLVVAPIAR